MPSTVSKPITGRVPVEQAAAFRSHAARYGLTTSQAIAALVARANAVEQRYAAEGEDHDRRELAR